VERHLPQVSLSASAPFSLFTIGQVRAEPPSQRAEQVAECLKTTRIDIAVRNSFILGTCPFGSACGRAAILALWLIVALIFWLYHERIIFAAEASLERSRTKSSARGRGNAVFFPNIQSLAPHRLYQVLFRHALSREYRRHF